VDPAEPVLRLVGRTQRQGARRISVFIGHRRPARRRDVRRQEPRGSSCSHRTLSSPMQARERPAEVADASIGLGSVRSGKGLPIDGEADFTSMGNRVLFDGGHKNATAAPYFSASALVPSHGMHEPSLGIGVQSSSKGSTWLQLLGSLPHLGLVCRPRQLRNRPRSTVSKCDGISLAVPLVNPDGCIAGQLIHKARQISKRN